MSALAHPGSSVPFVAPRRRHLSLVPAGPAVVEGPSAEIVPLRSRGVPAASAAVRRSPAAASEAPLRMTARGRRVLAVLILAAAAGVGAAVGALVSAADPLPDETEMVTVQAGDTLWSIAASVASPGEDVREVMGQIAALNELDDDLLAAGQLLAVPADD